MFDFFSGWCSCIPIPIIGVKEESMALQLFSSSTTIHFYGTSQSTQPHNEFMSILLACSG